MKTEIRETKDGSTTLYVPELNEHYHSVNGALQESIHVFIRAGLLPALQYNNQIKLLEVGFGTGLNALLSLQQVMGQTNEIIYEALEKYPVPAPVIEEMHFDKFILNPELIEYMPQLHEAPWHEPVPILPNFELRKIQNDLVTYTFPSDYYNLIYFDAFAPEKQPELWADEIFVKLFDSLQAGGILVSYCAKGSFKRSLKAAGFTVEALPGPIGKREMTRAIRSAY